MWNTFTFTDYCHYPLYICVLAVVFFPSHVCSSRNSFSFLSKQLKKFLVSTIFFLKVNGMNWVWEQVILFSRPTSNKLWCNTWYAINVSHFRVSLFSSTPINYLEPLSGWQNKKTQNLQKISKFIWSICLTFSAGVLPFLNTRIIFTTCFLFTSNRHKYHHLVKIYGTRFC